MFRNSGLITRYRDLLQELRPRLRLIKLQKAGRLDLLLLFQVRIHRCTCDPLHHNSIPYYL